jgi:alpha/beta superfamily hydrolase
MPEDLRLSNAIVPGPEGPLEGLINVNTAVEPRAIAILAHPLPTAGGTMHTKAVFHAARAFARIGCPVLRFNFRGVGLSGGVFDEGRGECDDFTAAVDFMVSQYPNVPRVWAAGMSFGSWVAMTTGARDRRISALIGIAPPVNKYDFSAVVSAAKPTFLIHGELDELVPAKDVRRFYGQLSEPKELAIIDAANHLFDGHVAEVGEAVADLLQDYDD